MLSNDAQCLPEEWAEKVMLSHWRSASTSDSFKSRLAGFVKLEGGIVSARCSIVGYPASVIFPNRIDSDVAGEREHHDCYSPSR
jgi:hypothetical protein